MLCRCHASGTSRVPFQDMPSCPSDAQSRSVRNDTPEARQVEDTQASAQQSATGGKKRGERRYSLPAYIMSQASYVTRTLPTQGPEGVESLRDSPPRAR